MPEQWSHYLRYFNLHRVVLCVQWQLYCLNCYDYTIVPNKIADGFVNEERKGYSRIPHRNEILHKGWFFASSACSFFDACLILSYNSKCLYFSLKSSWSISLRRNRIGSSFINWTARGWQEKPPIISVLSQLLWKSISHFFRISLTLITVLLNGFFFIGETDRDETDFILILRRPPSGVVVIGLEFVFTVTDWMLDGISMGRMRATVLFAVEFPPR